MNINTVVRVRDTVREAVQFVRVNTQAVTARLIMFGAVVRVFVIVHSNMLVREQDIVREVGCHAAENIRVVTVLHITVGMAVLVVIPIVMFVRVGIQPRVRV